jgi:hypothetical protein
MALTLTSSQFTLLRKATETLLLLTLIAWYGSRKTLNIPFDKFTGGAHEQIFCGTHNVDHGYGIIDKVDPMDETIYWRFKTIHNHSPEDDTVLVEWYGMAEPNNKSWIK